jgi:hypothetical protein
VETHLFSKIKKGEPIMTKKRLMVFILCFLVISAWILGFSIQAEAQSNLKNLIGTWKLISIETVLPDGEANFVWMGKNPLGLIIYDQTGYMSVQFMRDPRSTFSAAHSTHREASPEEIKDAYLGYYAYFGTYEVNEAEGTVIHHVKGSLWPQEVGVDYKRFFKFSENRIVLSTPPMQREGKVIFNRITFERVEKGK